MRKTIGSHESLDFLCDLIKARWYWSEVRLIWINDEHYAIEDSKGIIIQDLDIKFSERTKRWKLIQTINSQ